MIRVVTTAAGVWGFVSLSDHVEYLKLVVSVVAFYRFDWERTCPLCRALVKPADIISYSDGSTSLMYSSYTAIALMTNNGFISSTPPFHNSMVTCLLLGLLCKLTAGCTHDVVEVCNEENDVYSMAITCLATVCRGVQNIHNLEVSRIKSQPQWISRDVHHHNKKFLEITGLTTLYFLPYYILKNTQIDV